MEIEPQYVCPGCKRDIFLGAVLGPDPETPKYGPLYWHSWCLKWYYEWERNDLYSETGVKKGYSGI